MKFDCGETWEEKKERRSKWHPFFTIIPRRVGEHDCRWLEVIERRGFYYPTRSGIFTNTYCPAKWKWEYRAKENK